MLLFSYANWDEIFRVCLGLCGQGVDQGEGIKNDNLYRTGGDPGETGEATKPLIKQKIEVKKEKHHVSTL